MKMHFKLFAGILVTALFCSAFSLPKNIQKKVKKEINKTFKTETFTLNPLVFESSDLVVSDFSQNRFFEVLQDQKLIGYAYVGNAPSKTDTFEYLVLFNANLIIQKAKVLVYREDYGGEIGSKRWLRQFEGKSVETSFLLQQNIAAISGATISVTSMTRAINVLNQSLYQLRLQQKI
ncbi:MAG: FMN-binding protein [Flavobacteriaceae bacterium]|mgnify:FL=1|jgi:Na+-translocating ferredoxin:NAD+ oxidoreductase RnfG subunit|nr:FMN-binding protein [Flavobacteriaceae bacterium]